jgi:hypothetical protein
MKKVVSTEQVCHLFANQLQLEAYNPTRSVYFYKDRIYSYGSHFCMAKFVGVGTILFTTRGYSNTTAKHLSILSNATSHLNKIYCAYPTGTHEENFNYWLRDAESIAKGLINARKPEKYLNELASVKLRAEKYATYFGISLPENLNALLSIGDKAEFLAYQESKTRLLEAENKRKQAEKMKALRKELKDWRAFQKRTLYNRVDFDYLRKDAENFETSQGVKIPINVGLRLYNNIRNLKVGDKFLDYIVGDVTKDFIQIGCHKLKFSEIDAIAKA